MSLPAPNTAWPPAPWDVAYRAYRENEAWYLGDTEMLEQIYRSSSRDRVDYVRNATPMRGGLVGAASRMFWGRPVPVGETRTRLHIPAPADLASLAADAVFSIPPEVQLSVATTDGTAASAVATKPSAEQKRLDVIANSDEAHAMFNTMGELKSVYGATVITSEWDVDIADHVWLACYAVDVVIPEFRKGKLVGATMWTEYRDKNIVWRHLERHEIGRIEHALYEGTADNIGRIVPLTERSETEYLAKMVNADGAILTGLDRLTASFNINMPTRAWRKKGALADAGRSDFAGLHPLFDALDETWSSWMRDLKLGAGKLLLDQSVVDSIGPGMGGTFDMGREAFIALNMPGNAAGGQKTIDKVQFEIRVEAHERTANAIAKKILQSAGQGTRNVDNEGNQLTATGELARDKREEITRDKKILYDKRAIAEQSSVALELDGKLFPGKGGGRFEMPDVIFADVSQEDPEKTARTIQYLDAAGAVSTIRKVELANPDWDDKKVLEEAARIRTERASAPDPAMFTGDDTADDVEPPL